MLPQQVMALMACDRRTSKKLKSQILAYSNFALISESCTIMCTSKCSVAFYVIVGSTKKNQISGSSAKIKNKNKKRKCQISNIYKYTFSQ